MRMPVYLSVVSAVLFLGFVMTYFRDRDKMNALAANANPQSQQRFQQMTMQYAEKTFTEPVTEWLIYGGRTDAIVVDGMGDGGEQNIKCVFDRATGCPLSIICLVDENTPILREVVAKKPRDRARWWLRRLCFTESGPWQWVRDGDNQGNRYLSFWRSADYDVSLSVDTRTGKLIALRLERKKGEA